MKRALVATSLSLALVLGLTASALASGSAAIPGGGWWSGEQVQNVGSVSGDITVTAYDSASSSTYSSTKTIAAGASATFLPADFSGMPSGFIGSAIVSASVPIQAITNVTNRLAGSYGVSGGLAAGQYQGMTAGDTTLYFPLAKNNLYNKTTTFYIQNAGSSAATALATFHFGGSPYTFTTPSIAPGAMVAVVPADAGAPSGTSGNGSLVVTSSQPMAGVVMEAKTSENPATLLQATRGFTTADAGTVAYAPIIKNNLYGRFTGLQVQNVSGGPVNITVAYTTSCGGGPYSDSATGVASLSSATFVHLTGQTNLPDGCLASATVTGTGNIVAIVSESYTAAFLSANPGRSQESTTYSAFPNAAKTAKLSAPLFKENAYGKGTGLQVMNVGSSTATNVVLAFTGPTGTYTSMPQTITAGNSLTFVDVRNKAPSFWNGTAMTPAALGGCPANTTGCGTNGVFGVVVTADQPIVAIANESTYPFGAPLISQDKSNYECFNLTP